MKIFLLLSFYLGSLADQANAKDDLFNYDKTEDRDFGPNDWGKVECKKVNQCKGWPTKWDLPLLRADFINMAGRSNRCLDCSNSIAGDCNSNKQSPINLHKDITSIRRCFDWHRMHFNPGNCRFGQLNFQILPHTLRAYQPLRGCQIDPCIDFSKGFPNEWLLRFTDIKVPSEHTLEGKQYAGEVVLSHVLAVNKTDKEVGNVVWLLEEDPDAEDYDFLELYIRRFENDHNHIVAKCNLTGTDYSNTDDTVDATPENPEETDDFNMNDFNETANDTDDITDDYIDTDDSIIRKMIEKGSLRGLGQDRSLVQIPRDPPPVEEPLPMQVLNRKIFNREFTPYDWYLKGGTHYYFRYEGSTTEPPCLHTVHWRIMRLPIKVPPHQIRRIEKLLAERVDRFTCQRYTAGRRRKGSTTAVDVNRPIQRRTWAHKLVYCECIDFESNSPEDREYCALSNEERGVKIHPLENP